MQRPAVKPVLRPVRLPDGRIAISPALYGVGAEIADPTGQVWRLLELLDGTRTEPDAIQALRAEFPDCGGERAAAMVDQLIQAGIVEDAGASLPDTLREEELERYRSGELYFSWVDTEPRPSRFDAQRRLKASRVAILGWAAPAPVSRWGWSPPAWVP